MGRYEEGIEALRKRVESPDAEIPSVMSHLVRAYALAGRRSDARALLSDLLRLSERSYVPPSYVARALASLGETDPAFEWLGKAVEEHDANLGLLMVSPVWDPLRADPRFANLLRRIGLQEN